ncbi:MAG TPA: hypothetical protein VLA36_06325 [Longimicrobiales bacterium]|nr:hypothetical protein [Longimicrobiales bacterium]
MTNDMTTDTTDSELAPPPDEKNPALIDAEHAYIITLISAALFVGAVFVFIL